MPFTTTDDGVRLHFECSGTGVPLLFIHEFAGDARSWEPQVRHFETRHRCIVYDARGFPPSDVPAEESAYSQARAVDDALAVLNVLDVERAHVVGLSMGGFCALHLGLRDPRRALSLVVAGCGYGAHPDARESFRREAEAVAAVLREEGAEAFADRFARGPARVQLERKNPVAWELFASRLARHSAEGSALTMLAVQRLRPSLYDLEQELSALTVPTLILAGDEDEGCLEPALMLKRTIRSSGLAILPRTGHTCNLEEPQVFNEVVERFLIAVDEGSWGLRDRAAEGGGIMGLR